MRFYNVVGLGACAIAVAVASPAAAQPSSSRDPFHDVASLNARLRALAAAHPTTARVVTITEGERGEVLALEVDPSGAFAVDAPSLLVQGGIHGNEWISTEVVLRLAELTVDAKDPSWRGLAYRFVPAINIDGFARGSRKANGTDGKPYDPNREFPVPGAEDHASQPLIQGLRDYVQRGKVVAVLDYHSAAECLLWPFAYDGAQMPPDGEAIAAITKTMAMSVGFCSGQVAKVISYKHQGTASDWYQGALGATSILMELGPVDDPGSPRVEQVLIEQERPYRLFLAWLEDRGLKARPPAPAAGCAPTTIAVGEGPLAYEATGPVCDGLRHGAWQFRFAGGGLLREGEYVRGREHGAWHTFHPTGEPLDVGSFVDGKPDGAWKRLGTDGAVVEQRSYVAGWRDGELKRWNRDGALWQVRACTERHLGKCATQCKLGGRTPCELVAARAAKPDRHAKRSPTRKVKAVKAVTKRPATKPRKRRAR